jgi:hypothetical protein
MPERILARNVRLFEVRLLHHYWLDEGATVFDDIADQAKRNARLLAYDMRQFLAIRPTPATADALRGLRCLFRETALGCVVLAPDTAVIAPDTVFAFIVTAKHRTVQAYTALTLRPQSIHELFNAADKTLYRYKENVPVLSNLTGTTRGTGPSQSLFLSREIPSPSADDPVESLVRSGNALLQLTSDNPGATTQQLGAQANALPAYVHQGDAPEIVPPAGLAGTPARGVRLTAEISDDVFTLITLTAVRGDDAAFSFVDAAGAPKSDPPVYQVRFKNRATVWSYLDKRTGTPVSAEASALPLTHFGNAGTKQKPSAEMVKAEKSGSKVTRIVSEIYE